MATQLIEAGAVEHRSRRTRLSSQTVAAFKAPPRGQRLEVSDTGAPGLKMRVSVDATGRTGKSWSVLYRVAGEGPGGTRGKPKRKTLGTFPLVALDAARDLARAVQAKADAGIDAQAEERARVEGRDLRGVPAVVARFVDEHAKVKGPASWQAADRWLTREVAGAWSDREIADMTQRDVHALLDGIVRKRGDAAAVEVRKHLSKLFNWALNKGMVAGNPCVMLRRDERYEPRERVLEMRELRAVWDAAGRVGDPFASFFRLLILTGQRRGEIAGLRRDWLSVDDADLPRFRVPPDQYKTGKLHEVPLSAEASAIVDALAAAGVVEDSEPVDLSKRPYLVTSNGGRAPVSGFSKAKLRLGRELASAGIDLDDWTIHDIRRSVATGMAGIGVPVDHIERVLGHSLEGVRRVYQRHRFEDEKRAALDAWGALWT